MAEHIVQRPTVTISASPDYAAGDAINTGAIELNPMPLPGIKLGSLVVRDVANQGPAFYLLFFRANPSASTITDNAAFALHADDVDKLCGIVEVLAADYITVDTKKFTNLSDLNLDLSIAGADGNKSLWLVLVATAAYNAAATTNLRLELGFVKE